MLTPLPGVAAWPALPALAVGGRLRAVVVGAEAGEVARVEPVAPFSERADVVDFVGKARAIGVLAERVGA